MGIPLWSSPPPKGLELNPTSQDPPLSSSSSSSSSSASSGSIPLGDGGTGLLTIAEFLREHAPGDDTERHLNGLMRLRRRMVEAGSNNNRGQSHAAAAPPASVAPHMGADEAITLLRSRSLFEHTPAGRARILGGMSSLGTAASSPRAGDADGSLPPLPSNVRSSTTGASSSRSAAAAAAAAAVAAASPPPSNISHLAGHIRRIGELQDFVQAAADIVETPNQGRSAGDADPRTPVGPREARLRAMQNRIDFLASEFQLLRNTRRELRRVEEDALEIRNAAAGIVSNPSRVTRPAPQSSSFAPSRSGTSARAHRQIPTPQRSRRTQVARRILANISDDEDTDPDDDDEYSTPSSVAISTRSTAALSTPSTGNLPTPVHYFRDNTLLARVTDVRLARESLLLAAQSGEQSMSGQQMFENFERELETQMAVVRPEGQSPAILTAAQRDAMIRSVVMRMQIESLPTGNTF